MNYKSFKNSLNSFICKQNYKRLIKKVRNKYKKQKIRVLFYAAANQKWKYQVLYDLFDKDPDFEPLVVISLICEVHSGKDRTRMNLEENYNFFKSRGMNVEYAYKNQDYIDLKKFKPDIVFYEQQWNLPHIHKPKHVSGFALTMYSPYAFEMFELHRNYSDWFYKRLYKFFVEHPLNMERYESYNRGNSDNCIVTGYGKLDAYFEDADDGFWREPSKKRIIYAPHHSIGADSLKLATFPKSGKFILEMAKAHVDTTWIFKPHPRFKYELLLNEIMTEGEIEEYYNEWEKIGNVYTEGDYIRLFKSSDMMITDCGSFLAEYLPSGNPLIRLTNNETSKFNKLGEKLVSQYYFVYDNIELKKTFEDLLAGNDFKKQEREKLIPEIIDFKKRSSQKIYEYIIKDLEGKL